MKKEESKKETKDLDYKEQDNTLPEDALMHNNGYWYRELTVDGVKDKVKLFNCSRPNRLDGETTVEYKIRRKFLKHTEKYSKHSIYNPFEGGRRGITKGVPYVNENKKDKFKKKK